MSVRDLQDGDEIVYIGNYKDPDGFFEPGKTYRIQTTGTIQNYFYYKEPSILIFKKDAHLQGVRLDSLARPHEWVMLQEYTLQEMIK